MKTTKEKIEVMQAYEGGREIEYMINCAREEGWHKLSCDPCDNHAFDWYKYDYRIKQSTILVNGIEVPEPCRVMPPMCEKYFAPNFSWASGVSNHNVTSYEGASYDYKIFRAGLMHLTESAARQHYEALIAPSRVKK